MRRLEQRSELSHLVEARPMADQRLYLPRIPDRVRGERLVPVLPNVDDGPTKDLFIAEGWGDRPLPRISIFMSVFNCHVNRSPVAGRIDRIAYRPGTFINAELDKASEDNERNSLVISTTNGRIGVVQIAGLVARRIVSFVREGQAIGAGERFGLIRFGSRLDVYLPEGTRSLVSEGQTAIAGETILADFGSSEQGRTFRAD